MANKLDSGEKNEPPRSQWPLVLLGLFFGLLIVARPDLFWQLLVGLAVFLAGLYFFMRSEQRFIAAENPAGHSSDPDVSNYHSVINALQFPVYLLDRNANVRHANAYAASVFGNVRSGDRITIRFRQPQLRQAIDSALQEKLPMTIEYNETVPHDRWFQVEVSPLRAQREQNRDEEELFLLAFHDHTEAHRMDRMRSDFIANASHELRTPLASLLGYLETIRGAAKNDPEAQARFTDVMQNQAERMTRLVNDLLSLSRIEMKSNVKPSDTVEISEILNSVVSSFEPLAQQLNVKIETELEEELRVTGDRDELYQVFSNLLENGCKYGQEGKRVVVSARRTNLGGEPAAEVSVKDFGIGIAPEHHQRITERFYRVDVARSREKQGTGLGLAIVKHILNRHGSRLQLNSTPGEGAEFVVQLKLAEGV